MLTDWKLRLRSLFRRSTVDHELDDELWFHFEQQVAHHVAQGVSQDEAVRLAGLEFGGFEQTREDHRDARGVGLVYELAADFRYAARQMRRSPSFTLLAIGCLGVGIGINTAVFSSITAVLLRPLAVAAPDRLVTLTRGGEAIWPYTVFEEARQNIRGLTGLAASLPMESDVDVDGSSDFVVAEAVSPNYGDVLGPTLQVGRWFANEGEAAAVISDSLWERRFNREPGVVGRLIRSESQSYTIVGVTPRGFTGVFAPMRTDLWVPARTRPTLGPLLERPSRMLMVFGRLQTGTTVSQAGAELRVLDEQLASSRTDVSEVHAPLSVEQVRGVPNPGNRRLLRTVTILMAAVVSVVLLIACVNVGNLLLVRGAARQREFSVRRALGASRSRLLRQLLTESLFLAAGGCVSGVFLALATTKVLSASLPSMVPAFSAEMDLSLDWRAVAFAIVVSIAAGVLCSLLPARRASQVRGLQMLRGEAVVAHRRRPIGAVAQVALSLLLLLVAGSFLQRLLQLQSTDPGFAVDTRLYAYTFLPSEAATPQARGEFYRQAIERLHAIPGVTRVALASALPLTPAASECVSQPSATRESVTVTAVGAGYFDTIGIELIAGRDFGSTSSSPEGVIVNETLARRLWPRGSATGQRLMIGCDTALPAMVLGVARDSVVGAVGEAAKPHVYRRFAPEGSEGLIPILVEVQGDAGGMVEPVRRSLTGLGHGIRVYAVQPLSTYVEQSYGELRWTARVVTGFGLLALLLAVVGLYGVMAYRVALRTREIGVRMALGAKRADVFREVLGHGLLTVLLGLAIGEAVALVATSAVRSMVEGIHPPSMATHAVTAALWIGAALFACYIPAARAAYVDPLVALRHE
jgi:putative ABC transport system permease protein